jgi:CBS domain-containing protein
MYIGEICTRNVVICTTGTSIADAARLMRQYHVGDLVVVEERNGKRVPTGVVTDRDIVVEIVALNAPLENLTIGDIKSRELIAAKESDDVLEVLEQMQRHGIRRIPVTDNYGALAGIATLDDLLEILAEELGTMVKLISREQSREAKSRPAMPSGVEAH